MSFNTRELTLRAVDSALTSERVESQVRVVDNGSSDGSAEALRRQYPKAEVIELAENVGFGRGNNVALAETDAPWVLLLNSDARFQSGLGLRQLVDSLVTDAGAGVVGPRLVSPVGDLEYSARAFPGIIPELVRRLGVHRLLPARVRARRLGAEFHDHQHRSDVDWLTGACLLVRREVLQEVGGFDPEIFLYGEELEWCWRVRKAGWRVVFEPGVTVVHDRGASSPSLPSWRLRLAMAGDAYTIRRHRGSLYLAAFFGARTVALLGEAAIQGLWGLVPGQAHRRDRGAHAARSLVAWLSAVLGGGATHPSVMARAWRVS